jgi:hypothetical protein
MSATLENNLVNTKVDRKQIMAIGNQIRLSDSDPHLQLDMYAYNTCKNDDPDIIKKCNGVIFKKDNVVAPGLPFIETYLSSDKLPDSFINSKLRSFLCYEGTLIRIFFFESKWLVTTNKKLNAFRSKWSSKDSYGNIFKNSIEYLYSQLDSKLHKLLGETSTPYNSFLNTLDKNNIYVIKVQNTFENRIVCHAPEFPTIYHIGTFKDNIFNLDDDISIQKPEEKTFENNDKMLEFVEKLSINENVGLDVYNQNNKQSLIMNSEYATLHSVRGNEPSIKFRYLQIRMEREKVDMLYYLYPKFADQFDNYENIIYECAKQINYNYIKRFIKKKYITVPQEEYHIMKKCHQWHIQDRERNRISLTKIIEILNEESATVLNRIIRKYKSERETQQTRQQIRLLNPRAKSYGTPQIQPLRLEPVNQIDSLKI